MNGNVPGVKMQRGHRVMEYIHKIRSLNPGMANPRQILSFIDIDGKLEPKFQSKSQDPLKIPVKANIFPSDKEN